MDKTVITPEESRRRYYLDVMGVQCWESLVSPDTNDDLAEPSEGAQQVEQVQAGHGMDVVATAWPSLLASIDQCESCGLHGGRKQALAGRGSQQADLVFVLLSPDAQDDTDNMLCDGEAGDLLRKMLAAIDLSLDDVYLTSLLKCAPAPRHTILPAEISACDAHLKQQLSLIRPKVVIVLGELAARCMLQKRLSIDDFRAMNATDDATFEGYPLFVSYSPRELLLQAGHKRKAWQDLQQLQRYLEG